ncbi:DUF983 domain-containing protein [Sphingomonas morindae]|uniref:DUF983 domain-containing protein n=1 Tax=Sphingomonas morindae TaxID=1541170 RepID=A0ABY4X4L0_9SPHN|nr:DUF983 domain-containing protein [Sphingomonas morindae]USI71824.1 DUF983 domain-containing protein [Sphingomonas morindae]
MDDPAPALPPPPRLVAIGLKGLCPRCGAPTLFSGLIAFAPRCAACGLDFTAFNVGDGPAAFLTLIVGTLVCIGAIALELTAHPPFWVHVLIWVPVTLGLVLVLLRVAKAMLLASEYRNRAGEGRLAERDPR